MDIPRLGESVFKVTVLQKDVAGTVTPVVIYKAKRSRKKGSKGLKQLEKLARKFAAAQRTFVETYVDRHKESNEERRDGWLRDLTLNNMEAARKARRRLK